MAARGIYECAFTRKGRRRIVAVDRYGEWVDERECWPHEIPAAWRELERELEKADPDGRDAAVIPISRGAARAFSVAEPTDDRSSGVLDVRRSLTPP